MDYTFIRNAGELMLGTAIALALTVPAAAQETPPARADTDAAADDSPIIVTGSRLARDPNSTAPTPISTVSADDFANSGNADASATLRQIPALISSGTVADSVQSGGGNGVGQATLNLRNLGINRTLVLVDGYRHVSGVAGSQTVDVSTIPPALLERVEVLTGGASAIYGADAVTGVVNFVQRKDFTGLEINGLSSIASAGSGASQSIDATYGRSFADDRGNITFSAGYTLEQEVLLGDRPSQRDNGVASNSTTYANPARRFQRGDISAEATPNFASRFSQAAGRFPIGFAIPTAAQFATLFPGVTPTSAEAALIGRASDASLFVIGRDPRFAISSNQGLIFRNDFGFFNADINSNGVNDCRESYIGLTGFGGGGCYVSTPGGGVRIFEDGVVSTGSNQFGGDGSVERTNESSLIPRSERIYGVLRARYEFSPAAEVFVDAKYARNTSRSRNNYNGAFDSLLIFPDNPFIPPVLQADADEAGGLRVSRDYLDLGANTNEAKRETYRVVGGIKGALSDHLRYEVIGNYGRTDNALTRSNAVLSDRLFAAIDVVRGPNGQPICRSDISNTPHPGSEIFPVVAPGFFTFRPGDGQCRPANILAGANSVSQEAVDFITTPTTNRFRLEQYVATATISGDTEGFFTLPGGAVQFVVGAEYRKEKSTSRFDDLVLGNLPAGSPAGAEGTFIGAVSPNQSLVGAQSRTLNAGGQFDVKEVFAEVSLPILRENIVHELTIGAAGRYADYSTVGGAFTWNVHGIFAPIEDIRFRGTYSRAIRAPNIAELFDPAQGALFRPADPCDLISQNATPNRRANCIAAAAALGIPNPATFIANYTDPLTAVVAGTSGGNPNLKEETATTWTVGAVLQPRFLRGLTLSADYYSIRIDDAIAPLTPQDIVNTCYDNSTFPNQFCALFERKGASAGQTAFGFSFLQQTQLNFGKIETSGIDFTAAYRFNLGAHKIGLRVAGNWTEKIDRFFDPVDTSLVNPGRGELGAPEWSGVGTVSWTHNDFGLTYNVQYIGKQAIASAIQIERIATEFGPAGIAPEYWVHGIAANYDVTDRFTLTGGVNNLTNKQPYPASLAYPVSGMGRLFFIGARASF